MDNFKISKTGYLLTAYLGEDFVRPAIPFNTFYDAHATARSLLKEGWAPLIITNKDTMEQMWLEKQDGA